VNQPTFTDGPPVPLMVEGLIDAATLRQLFADLATAAKIISIREKVAPTGYAATAELPPADALQRLLDGSSPATQVRYHHDGHEWTDTLLATPAGYRVVRCRHEP
jgi:hypothetical protein